MKRPIILLMAALSLIMSASAQTPTGIPITSLPFTITAPGTYIVTGDLSTSGSGITINASAAGKIILDLNGHTIYGYGGVGTTSMINSGVAVLSNPTASSITIRNGTITFWIGVNVNPVTAVVPSTYLSNIHVENINLAYCPLAGVSFFQVNSSTVINCSFVGHGNYAIEDLSTQTGNQYAADSFENGDMTPLYVTSTGPLVLGRCQFQAPPK